MQENAKVNLIGSFLFVMLIVLIALPIYIHLLNPNDALVKVLIYVGCSGGIGGTVYCIRGFYQNLGGSKFKPNWIWWYFFRPMISSVMGVFAYFLIMGGLLSINSSPDVSYSKGLMFYCAIAFLAGFSFTQFADKLEELASTLFSKTKGEKELN